MTSVETAIEKDKPDEELWKGVVGFEGYYKVSSFGNIIACDRIISYVNRNGIVVTYAKKRCKSTICIDNNGYPTVSFCVKGIQTQHRVHRLVAEAFIKNPNNYRDVNHKDEVKSNNYVHNLEWCTPAYNNMYGLCSPIKARYRSIRRLDSAGNVLDAFCSISEAEKAYGTRHIGDVCKGKRQYAGGYKWEYVMIQ